MIPASTRNVLVIAVASLLVSPSVPDLLCAQGEKPGHQQVWKVKESSTRLWIADGMLVSSGTPEAAEVIPLSKIRALAYETSGEHQAAGDIKAWVEDMLEATNGADPEIAGFIIFPMAAGVVIPSIFLPLKKTRHLIYVDWDRDGKVDKRVYLLSKSDAISLLNELKRATGLQCSSSDRARCSNWVALEKSSGGEDSATRHQRGRLVVVDRGHGISSLEIAADSNSTAVDCRWESNDPEAMREARRNLEEVGRTEEGSQTPSSPVSGKPRLRLPSNHLGKRIILSEMTCKEISSQIQ